MFIIIIIVYTHKYTKKSRTQILFLFLSAPTGERHEVASETHRVVRFSAAGPLCCVLLK